MHSSTGVVAKPQKAIAANDNVYAMAA
jgi:hypothetical protein